MKYTKGEWYWEYADQMHHNLRAKSTHPSGCAEDKHILFVAPDFLGEDSLINDADANLIASAPDLYEVAKDIAQMVWDRGDRKLKDDDRYENLLQAIAKAEGK